MIDINIQKKAAEIGPVNIQRMVTEVAEISIQGMAIGIIELCHTEVATIDQNKILTNGTKNKPLNKSGNISCCVMCQSIYH